MPKVLVIALAFLVGGAFAQSAFAKTTCEQRREVCYSAKRYSHGPAVRCDVRYGRCVRVESIYFEYPPVSSVTGLGTPMLQPYPTGRIQVNPGIAAANAAKAANARGAKGRARQNSSTQ